MELILKVSRDALTDLDDELLAKCLADKRVYDYKKALYLRDVLENNSLGSYAWIFEQDQKKERAEEMTTFETTCAQSIFCRPLFASI